MTKASKYITTPIYYVNDSPHIGHAYTTIAADVMARFLKLDGNDVFFLTGTDEHGQKVAKSAQKKGVDTLEFCDEVSARFRRLVDCPNETNENLLDISNDDFIRTTEERHKKAAQALWERIKKQSPDSIYKDKYAGWYSVRDEAYYAESELIEKDGNKLAPTGAEVEWVEEESYFFKLSAYQDRLLKFYDDNPDFVLPTSRLNEVKSFVSGGLQDLSISRTTFDWGVKVPGDEAHVMYVWIDALTNYLTAAGFPDDSKKLNKYWGEETLEIGNAIHFVGKDILRFHAVYWPAFLMAANLPLPKQIVAHGWWTIEGEKMSKSIGNVLSPDDMVQAAGGVDCLRYFMLRAMPFGNDGDFSESRMIETVNADLANNIGNLAQRSLTMIQKNCGGMVPSYGSFDNINEQDKPLFINKTHHSLEKYKKAFTNFAYNEAAAELASLTSEANEYITAQAPWALKKSGNEERMKQVLYVLAETIRIASIMLLPFCPKLAGKLLDQLSIPEGERIFANLTADYALKPNTELPAPQPIFPRIEAKKEAA